jgi:toxin HigB-1
VKIEYADKKLEKLATDAKENGGFAQPVVATFRRRVQLIAGAVDERDFYALKSLHYEKLKGNRAGQRSMRIDKKWRLILEIIEAKKGNVVRLLGIEDYHK